MKEGVELFRLRTHTHTRVFDSELRRVWRLEVFSKTANFWGNPRTLPDSPVDFDSRNELEVFLWVDLSVNFLLSKLE